VARSSSQGPRVAFDVKGDAEAVEVARALGSRARDAKPLMQAFLAEMVIIEREQFESSGARGGKPWPENKPSTIARKKAAGQDERPERRTGALERSLTGSRGGGAIRRASKGSVTVGTRIPYARYAGKKRPLIGVMQSDQEHWLEQVIGYLLNGRMPR
jgi:hypothetical protein